MDQTFATIIAQHAARWPLMEPADYVKLAYQSEFGPAHMLSDLPRAEEFLRTEWRALPPNTPILPPEPIGGGLCRFHLASRRDPDAAAPLLLKALTETARTHKGAPAGLEEKLAYLDTLPVPGMGAFLEKYREAGCPMLRHSETYRSAYAPHYRLLTTELARELFDLLNQTP